MIQNGLTRPLSDLLVRLRGLLARGVVKLVNDAAKIQAMQVTVQAGETRDAQRFQNYGVTSVPKAGAEAIVLFVGGDRGQAVVLAVEDKRYRPKGLQPGEVAIYTDEGDLIVFKRGRTIQVTTTTLKLTGNLDVTGDVRASGQVADGTRSIAADRLIFNAHIHSGVQSGSGTSGPPTIQE